MSTTARMYPLAPRALVLLAAYRAPEHTGHRARIARAIRTTTTTNHHPKGNR